MLLDPGEREKKMVAKRVVAVTLRTHMLESAEGSGRVGNGRTSCNECAAAPLHRRVERRTPSRR